MNGFEYQAAIHMIQEGLIDEGLEIVAAIRDRYDGEKRNPWNEFECGSNYARSMASYALLNALSGFEFDMVEKRLGFDPVIREDTQEGGRFCCFWSLDAGWGTFEVDENQVKLRVLYGNLELSCFRLPFAAGRELDSVAPGEDYSWDDGQLIFKDPLEIDEKTPLVITFSAT